MNKIKASEPTTIVCSGYAHPDIPGKWTFCSGCKARVYVSDSSYDAIKQSKYAEAPIELLCFHCVGTSMKDSNTMKLSKRQMTEIYTAIPELKKK